VFESRRLRREHGAGSGFGVRAWKDAALTRDGSRRILWQIVVALVIGWGLFTIALLMLLVLGWSPGRAAIWAMLMVGLFVFVVGVVSTDLPASEGPSWLARWSPVRRGPPDASSVIGGGLTLGAQCFVVSIPMLAIAGIFGT
jgi:hypothetical protein